jgi:hypothetical protein
MENALVALMALLCGQLQTKGVLIVSYESSLNAVVAIESSQQTSTCVAHQDLRLFNTVACPRASRLLVR